MACTQACCARPQPEAAEIPIRPRANRFHVEPEQGLKLRHWTIATWHTLPGDLLLKRRDGSIGGAAIAAGGRGPWQHAAMLDFDERGFWTVLETTFWRGATETPLAKSVARHNGLWDVFRPNADYRWPEFDPDLAVARMRAFLGQPYGWQNILRACLQHLPVVRCFLDADTNDQAHSSRPPFCSESLAIAYRAAGVDPVPHLADSFVEPSDLGRSPFFDYLFTLTA